MTSADVPPTFDPAPADDAPRADAAVVERAVQAQPRCLVAIAFAEPLLAQEALLAALRLKSHDWLGVEDAAIVSRLAGGRVRIDQTQDMTTIQGALSGGWIGMVASLFIPGGPLIGVPLGAAVGGLWAKLRDIGIDDDEMKRLGEELAEGHSALFLLLSDAHQARAFAELRRFDGRLLHSTLDPALHREVETQLGQAITTW